MKYLVVIEKAQTGYSAYSPDVLGCVSTGATLAILRTFSKPRITDPV
jgi:predicted RNase H-like HicB family nuclease